MLTIPKIEYKDLSKENKESSKEGKYKALDSLYRDEQPAPAKPAQVKPASAKKPSSEVKRMGALDKEVTISFNLKKVITGLLVVVVLLGVFYLGRCTADTSSSQSSLVEKAAVPAPGVEREGFFSRLLSFFSSEEEAADAPAAVQTATVTAPQNKSNVAEAASQPVEPVVVAPSAPAVVAAEPEPAVSDEPEVFVTQGYSKVSIDITSVQHEWYGSWGKVTKINFKVINNEAGTITAKTATAVFEGYPDEADAITKPIPTVDQAVKKGMTEDSNIAVDFAYAQAQTDPANLRVTLTILDQNGNRIASGSKEFDLTRTKKDF